MISFLTECSLCNDNALFSIVYLVKQIMQVVFLVVPIILIVFLLIDIAKNVVAGKEEDMKKNKNLAIRRVIYAVVIFLVPFIVNIFMHVLYDAVGNESEVSFLSCWDNATLQNVRLCNEEAIENEKAKDEEKKQKSDQDMQSYKDKVKEQNDSKDKSLGKKEEDNNSDSGNSNGGNSSSDSGDGKGDTSDNYIIFVGDSRMVGLKSVVKASSNEAYVAKGSMGVTWLNSTAYESVVSELNNHKNANVIVNIGVNDITGATDLKMKTVANAYMSFCKKVFENYPDSRIIVTNVGPVDESVGRYKIKNSEIDRFNAILKERVESTSVESGGKTLKPKYCNVSYTGFKTSDGLHYMPSTYRDIIYTGFNNCLN